MLVSIYEIWPTENGGLKPKVRTNYVWLKADPFFDVIDDGSVGVVAVR